MYRDFDVVGRNLLQHECFCATRKRAALPTRETAVLAMYCQVSTGAAGSREMAVPDLGTARRCSCDWSLKIRAILVRDDRHTVLPLSAPAWKGGLEIEAQCFQIPAEW